jgi:hypothetical protein
MASTITASTLTTTVTESIFLNGTQQGGTSIKTFGSINEISKRILTITTNEVTIATFSAAVASTGHYNDSAVRYMRFTNKDDTNFITLTFTNEDNDEVAIKVDAGNSFIWAADNDGGMVDVFNATENAGVTASLADLRTIQADASASTIDLEMFIASV